MRDRSQKGVAVDTEGQPVDKGKSCGMGHVVPVNAETLPRGHGVDAAVLSRLFRDRTNSYKNLFFTALLARLEANAFSAGPIPMEDLAIGMLAAAWHPVIVCRLSLGVLDGTEQVLGAIPAPSGPSSGARLLAHLRPHADAARGLLRYVPTRLIRPFLEQHLAGVPEGEVDRAIRAASRSSYDQAVPLYRLDEDDTLEVHPRWAAYLAGNLGIVRAWAERHWIAYLQSRNPTVPAIPAKIAAPVGRRPLTRQQSYWRAAIASRGTLRCIYTDQAIGPDAFVLDHFVPFSFSGHDAIWNLIPAAPAINSAKGDRLPDMRFIPRLAAAHHEALSAIRNGGHTRFDSDAMQAFVGDLRMAPGDLGSPAAMLAAYERTIPPQLAIARSIGFAEGWLPRTNGEAVTASLLRDERDQ